MGSLQVYILHPNEIPIVLQPMSPPSLPEPGPSNLKLLCHSQEPYAVGSNVGISIPLIEPGSEVIGQVSGCHADQDGYEITVTFTQRESVMHIRMLEQLCYIHRYREAVRQSEGRHLNEHDAALEWVAKYAALFPVDHV